MLSDKTVDNLESTESVESSSASIESSRGSIESIESFLSPSDQDVSEVVSGRVGTEL